MLLYTLLQCTYKFPSGKQADEFYISFINKSINKRGKNQANFKFINACTYQTTVNEIFDKVISQYILKTLNLNRKPAFILEHKHKQ